MTTTIIISFESVAPIARGLLLWSTIAIVVSRLQLVQQNRLEKNHGYHGNVHIAAAYYNTSGNVTGIPDDATAEPGHEWPRAMLLLFHGPC